MIFATNFIGNNCQFYNCVGNNYPQKKYILNKFLTNYRKKSFFCKYFNKFTRKISYNMRIFSSEI